MRSKAFLLSVVLSVFSFWPTFAIDRDDLIDLWHWVKDYVDSADVKGVDPSYLELPEKGFLAQLDATLSGTELSLNYNLPNTEYGTVNIAGHLNTEVARLYTLGVSYRGWGLSYSADFSSFGDTEWAFSSYGQSYGFEARIHNSRSMSGMLEGTRQNEVKIAPIEIQLGDMHQRTILANLYYVFDKEHFSLPAAMSHTVIQRRSAGSFMSILNFHHISSDINDPGLSYAIGPAFLPEGQSARSRFRKLSQTQLSLGGGYGYNYVFSNPDFLLHGSVMPMLSIWHRNRTYWDVVGQEASGQQIYQRYASAFSQSSFTVNANAHLSFIYNHDNVVSGLIGIINYDSLPGKSQLSIYTFDWSASIFLGFRF